MVSQDTGDKLTSVLPHRGVSHCTMEGDTEGRPTAVRPYCSTIFGKCYNKAKPFRIEVHLTAD
jgi:hypothetical protein